MGVTTWLDRITDESNLWLSASKAEEARDFASAAHQFLTDAIVCFERGSRVRAALSCFCAAECLGEMGADVDSRRLYLQSGRLYSSLADHGVSGSIREALWALQRAYASYMLADQTKESEATLEAYKLLARRANPFTSGAQWLEMPKVTPRQPVASRPAEVRIPPDLRKAIENFVSVSGASELMTENQRGRPRRAGGMADDQESLVSQLG